MEDLRWDYYALYGRRFQPGARSFYFRTSSHSSRFQADRHGPTGNIMGMRIASIAVIGRVFTLKTLASLPMGGDAPTSPNACAARSLRPS
jgi:hypothetical protein